MKQDRVTDSSSQVEKGINALGFGCLLSDKTSAGHFWKTRPIIVCYGHAF